MEAIMKCDYCPHGCELCDTEHGYCKTKTVRDDRIVSLTYGQLTSIALDPIEKKPLRRFMPGSKILSVGSWGCNMSCPWCQNDSISRGPAKYIEMTPKMLISEAIRQEANGNIGVAYTYNEPLTNYDFVLESARLANEAGLKNVLVSNGMISRRYGDELFPLLDAVNFDLKTIFPEKYKKIGGDLDTVLLSIRRAAQTAHVEVTTLIVPGFNDSEEEMEKLSAEVADIGRDIALHISRFFPAGNMTNAAPTDVGLIYRLKDIAEENLDYVYTGNC